MKNPIIKTWQILTYFIVGIPLRIYFRVERKLEFKLYKGNTYIIAANHPSKADPFIICYSLPFKEFLKLVPFRFITTEDYMRIPLIGQILKLYGCISTKMKRNKRVLLRAKELLLKGETVFIFPRGEIEQKYRKATPKIGVAYLEKEIPNCYILPVKIIIRRGIFNRTSVHFKKEIRHKQFSEDLQPIADHLMKIIEN